MKKLGLLLALLVGVNSLAGSTTLKQIDNIQNSTGGSSLAVPGTGTTLTTDTNTQTMTNKTLTSPAITAPSITGSATITTATHVVDTTDTTKQLAFSLSGMTTAHTLTLSSSQTTTQTLAIPNVGSGDTVATLLATQTFGSGSTWNGVAIGATFGGTGSTATPTNGQINIGNGSGYTLTTLTAGSNITITNGVGSITIASANAAPTLTGSQASPTNVSAAGGLTLSSPITYTNLAFIQSSTAGNVTVTATPSISACTAAGQQLSILGEDATKTVTFQDEASLSGTKLHLNGNWTSSLNVILTVECDGNGFWIERSRSN